MLGNQARAGLRPARAWFNKGIFNYNIDHDWTGGVLVEFKKIIDKCTKSGSPNVQPAPSIPLMVIVDFLDWLSTKRAHIITYQTVIHIMKFLILLVIVDGVISVIQQDTKLSKLWQFMFDNKNLRHYRTDNSCAHS